MFRSSILVRLRLKWASIAWSTCRFYWLVDASSSPRQETTASLVVCTRFVAKGISELSMHRIDEHLGQLSDFIEQREISGVANICRCVYCINQQWALIGLCSSAVTYQLGVRSHILLLSSWRSNSGGRTDHIRDITHDSFIAVIHHRFRKLFAEIHHHVWLKWC